MKVWLVGGGTAGHVLPLLALASELKRLKTDSTLIIDYSATARRIAGEGGAWTGLHRVLSGKLRRYQGRGWLERLGDWQTLLLNLRDTVWVAIGFVQALILVVRQAPDAVFINGGAVGVPVAWACRLRRIPYLVHESDAQGGLANRMIAPNAVRILLGLAAPEQTDGVKTFVTGIPVRSEFAEVKKRSPKELKKNHGFDPNRPVVLVTGGSQGSQRLNEIVLAQAAELTEFAQVIHIAGADHAASTEKAAGWKVKNAADYRVYGFIGTEMVDFLRLADVVVSRSGATIMADLAYLGKATVLVPHPQLAHQSDNAAMFAREGAARVLDEPVLLKAPALLAETVIELIEHKHTRTALERAVGRLAHPDATTEIAGHIVAVAGQGRG